MATTKKAVKKSSAKVIPIAPATDKTSVKVKIGVDAEDMKDLLGAADRFEVAANSMQAAARVIAESKDPGEKQLHRRVVVAVYDAAGTRISNASHDLSEGDELTLNVGCVKTVATIATVGSSR
jgi:hypothetical protein